MKHEARVEVTGWHPIDRSGRLYPVYAKTCSECGRPVRRMTGLGVFWHSSGPVAPGDPRRHPGPGKGAAISAGMRAANARRKAARHG